MIDTGDRADLSFLDRPTVDKHSTGGVGDKISLILVPLVAACGAAVPQLAGRGLGHTGGTLDKMESIAGFQSMLPAERYRACPRRKSAGVIAGASGDIAPADRKLYALRDVTATVESIPLIASSIMSKKIAEGTKGLVLDVKLGSGSFLADDAPPASWPRRWSASATTTASVPSPCSPTWTSRSAGPPATLLEVTESLDVLAGGGPADVRAAHPGAGPGDACPGRHRRRPGAGARRRPGDGGLRAARRRPGRRPRPVPLPVAAHTRVVDGRPRRATSERIDCKAVGVAVWRLGAGRARKEDAVSFGAGALVEARVGDRVAGRPAHAVAPRRRPRTVRRRARRPRRCDRHRSTTRSAAPAADRRPDRLIRPAGSPRSPATDPGHPRLRP